MANSKQSKYRAERADRVRERRRRQLAAMRTEIKKLRKALADDTQKELLGTLYAAACKTLDCAVTKRLLHANRAARVKSRLNAQVKLAAA
tara:strand:- start:472 stop:741 length:270 start_codon:yes stop_codon:yes gene_type:complete